MRILFIEDSEDMRSLMKRYLSSWGHDVIGAPDGETAWMFILDYRPDVVITDWMMPDLDGPTLCKRIRKANLPQYTYVIMLTARKDDMVVCVDSGADDFIGKPFKKQELKVRLKAAERMINLQRELEYANAVLQTQNRRLKESEEALRRLAHFDRLTGLANRVLFFDRLERAVAESARSNDGFALLFIDLDSFKAVNDRYGHETGDQLLVKVGERVEGQVRGSDTVARMGGDEFCVILRGVSTETGAFTASEKIIRALSRPFKVNGSICRIGASIGVAMYPDDGAELETLISHADEAMYIAKRAGKGVWRRWCLGTRMSRKAR